MRWLVFVVFAGDCNVGIRLIVCECVIDKQNNIYTYKRSPTTGKGKKTGIIGTWKIQAHL